jgi:Zn-dependent peptidase ImmA (M78 family)
MSMPKKVKIGTQVFQIIERSKSEDGMLNEGTFGYTLDTENLIVVDAAIAGSRKKLTLFHEILHAARMVYDTSVQPRKSDPFDVWEHYFIGIWEESLLLVLKDNPELLDYILKDE